MTTDRLTEVIDAFCRQRDEQYLRRCGLLPPRRKREREERVDLARELVEETAPMTTCDQALARWLMLKDWKRWLWTVMR